MKIYAKVLDAEYFDYQCYEDDISEDIIVDGGRNFVSMHEDDLIAIKKFMDGYYSYEIEYYYNGSFKAFANDSLPFKYNKKHYSQIELHNIKEALEKGEDEETILLCLKYATGKEYKAGCIKGYCQGDYCQIYYPINTTQDAIDYLEAVYFGTGTEIEIHDENTEVFDADDIYGYRILTTKWRTEDIKKEIASYYKGAKPEDVVLYTIAKSYMVKHIEYQAE